MNPGEFLRFWYAHTEHAEYHPHATHYPPRCITCTVPSTPFEKRRGRSNRPLLPSAEFYHRKCFGATDRLSTDAVKTANGAGNKGCPVAIASCAGKQRFQGPQRSPRSAVRSWPAWMSDHAAVRSTFRAAEFSNIFPQSTPLPVW